MKNAGNRAFTSVWRGVVWMALVVMGLSMPALLQAHNLDTRATSIFFDQAYLATLSSRSPANLANPLIRVNDEFWLIVKTTPGPGTATGVGGYQTLYIPAGMQVVGAEMVEPDPLNPGGFRAINARGQSIIAIGDGSVGQKASPKLLFDGASGTSLSLGPNILGVTEKAVVDGSALARGTIAGVYADTGIFYSTDARTAFNSYGAPATLPMNNNVGDVVGEFDAVNIPGTDILGVMTLWDSYQLRAYGRNGGAAAGPTIAIIDTVDQRGNAPWGLANVVAGPQSGYQWEFNYATYAAAGTFESVSWPALPGARSALQEAKAVRASIVTGPWLRIRYPGSQISRDIAGSISTTLGYAGVDGSSSGVTLDLANPLPPSTTAVRFALGMLELGRPLYSRVKLKVITAPNVACPIMYADAFGGDAGGEQGGKDHIWRYFDPTVVSLSPCAILTKVASTPIVAQNGTLYFDITFANNGPNPTTLPVVLTDTLPTGLFFLSSVPAQSSGPNPLTYNLGIVPAFTVKTVRVNVRATSTGTLLNPVTTTVNGINYTAYDTVEVGNISQLSEVKTVTPSTVNPGGTVTYTLTVSNTGNAPSGVPLIVTEYLPTGFTYVSLVSADLNGGTPAPGVVTVNTSNPNRPLFTVSQGILPTKTLVLRFTALVPANATVGSYCNQVSLGYEGKVISGAPEACVAVGGGSIGDTVYRDWNGNGSQGTGEEGISGVTVTLYNDVNGDGDYDVVGDTSVGTKVTDANGNYLFTGLPVGNYVVVIASPPSGSTNTGNPVGGAGNPINQGAAAIVGANDAILTVDFGYQPTGGASIGDKVFDDKTGDGIFNGADVGIDGATVNLYEDNNANGILDAGDALITTQVTSGGGNYTFSNLNPTFRYLVNVTDGNGSGVDTYFADPYTRTVAQPRLVTPANFTAASNIVIDADFGYIATLPSSIGDTVFQDTNANGTYDGGDVPIAGVTVNLFRDSNNDGIPDGAAIATASTDAAGQYLFSNLGPDNYIVRVDTADPQIPNGYGATISEFDITLPVSTSNLTADFPFVPILIKTVDKAFANATSVVALDRTLTYTITPTYTGSASLAGLIISDPIPTGTTYVAASVTPGTDALNYVTDILDPPTRVEWDIGSTASAVRGVFTATGGTVATIYPSQDTYANQASPASFFNTSTDLIVAGTKNKDGKRSYLQFSLASIPGSSTITAASFRIESSAKAPNKNVTYSLYKVTSAWTAAALNWNVQPIASVTASGSFAVAKKAASKTQFTTSLLGLVQDWYATPAGNNGLVIKDLAEASKDNGDMAFASSETAGLGSDPVLSVTYSGVTDQRTFVDIATSRTLLTGTGPHDVTVTMTVTVVNSTLGGTLTAPTDLTRANIVNPGGTWTKQSGPIPTTQVLASGGTQVATFVYVYRLTGPPTAIGAVTWSGKPSVSTGTGFNPGNGFPTVAQFTSGTSRSVLVTPILTYKALITQNTAVNPIHNVATLDEVNLFGTVDAFADTATTVSIGDRVWADLDSDGVQDVGELGISGVTVRLYNDPNNNGIIDVGETQVASTTTDSNGLYFFGGLSTSVHYTVTYDLSGPVAGYIPTTDSDADAGKTVHDVTGSNGGLLGTGQQYVAADFGLRPPGTSTIGDTVWIDANEDGIVDASETGIANVDVQLWADTNNDGLITVGTDFLLQTVSTDASGNYLFSNVAGSSGAPVNYLVNVLESDPQFPAGLEILKPGGNNVNLTTGFHPVTISAEASSYLEADFAYNYGGSIGDTAYYDTDENGNQSGVTETGVNGVVITLFNDLGITGTFEPGIDTVVTTAITAFLGGFDGRYLFDNLPPGNYIAVAEEQTVVAPPSSANAGQQGFMVATTGTKMPVTLAANQDYLLADFGFVEKGLLEGTTFWDKNSNGVLEGATIDTRVPSIRVWLDTNNDGIENNGETAVDTDAQGNYKFLVPPGSYVVRYLSTDADWATANPSIQGPQGTQTTPGSYAVTVASGQEIENLNFGRDNSGQIGDTVYADLTGDRLQQVADPGIQGVTVSLYQDVGLIGTYEPLIDITLVDSQVTKANGEYLFQGLPAGTYVVKVDTSATSLPPNFTTLSRYERDLPGGGGDSTVALTLVEAVPQLDVDFGYGLVPSSLNVSGYVWNDQNANNLRTAGAEQLTFLNVTVRALVDLDQDGITDYTLTTTTDSTGFYEFTGIPATLVDPTNVRIVVDTTTLPGTGWTTTADPDGNGPGGDSQTLVTLTNASVADRNFGYVGQIRVGNRIWNDNGNSGGVQNDGIRQANEPGINGVIVQVYAADPVYGTPSGLPLATTTTANGGYYAFYLPPGDYVVAVPASNFAVSQPLNGLFSSGTGPTLCCNGPDPDTVPTDNDDNGYNAVSPTVTGVFSAAFTLTVAGEPTGELDLSPTDALIADASANLTVDFGFAPVAPTAITLASLKGWWVEGEVTVEWETISELNTAGFDLYRLMTDGERVRINTALIPALNVAQGGVYRAGEYLNQPSAPVQYLLVEIETTGKQIEYGPFEIVVAAPARVSAMRLIGDAVQLEFTGEPGIDYLIETTDDLIYGRWETAGRFRSDPSGSILYHQPLDRGETVRFYRALRP